MSVSSYFIRLAKGILHQTTESAPAMTLHGFKVGIGANDPALHRLTGPRCSTSRREGFDVGKKALGKSAFTHGLINPRFGIFLYRGNCPPSKPTYGRRFPDRDF